MDLDFKAIGLRIRNQREFLGHTREQFAEIIGITPKFCSDIELGVKGMSLQTLNQIVRTLKLPADFILYGTSLENEQNAIVQMLASCNPMKIKYAEEILKIFIQAID